MKSCPICHREYPEAVQFCTRDGTRLQTVTAVKYCPECPGGYSAEADHCPIHNLELSTQNQPAQSEVSHCILCNKHYPISFDNCPIHGISLKANNAGSINNPESNRSVANEVVETPAADESEDAQRFVVSEPLGQRFSSTDLISSPPVAPTAHSSDGLPSPVAETKGLTLPMTPTLNSLGQYSIDHAAADRKLIKVMASAVIVLILAFAVYSLPRVFNQAGLRAKESPKESNKEIGKEDINEGVQSAEDQPQIATNSETITINPSTQDDQGELIQRIELVPATNAKATDKTKPTSSTNSPIAEIRKIEPTESKTGARITSSANRAGIASRNTVGSKDKPVVTKVPADRVAVARVPGDNKRESIKEQTSPPRPVNRDVERASYNPPSPPWSSGSKNDDNRIATDRADNAKVDSSGNGQLKTSSHRVVKLAASVANKSRMITPNGYVYQFDLILKEPAGRGIKWRCTAARKVSYSGQASTVDGLLGDELAAGTPSRYRMVVRMTGSCIEDWYGQIVYTASGVNQDGTLVELEHSILLDNSFPIY